MRFTSGGLTQPLHQHGRRTLLDGQQLSPFISTTHQTHDVSSMFQPSGGKSNLISIRLMIYNRYDISYRSVEAGPSLASDHRVDKYASYLGKKGLTLEKCVVFYTYYRQRLARPSDEERKQPEHAEHLRELALSQVALRFSVGCNTCLYRSSLWRISS